MRLIWSRRALDGLREIQLTLDGVSSDAGARAAERILDAADRLIDFPQLGRRFGRPGHHLLVVGNTPFLLRYNLRADRIEILEVFNGARPWPPSS